MVTRDEWLAQIEANPGDWQMALIAADEIESDGDELFAEQLRFAVQWKTGHSYKATVYEVGEMEASKDSIEESYWRRSERKWCEANGVRFIPAFPRSLDDVYAGRGLV